MVNYHETALWNKAFGQFSEDKYKQARSYFESAYERFREAVAPLVSRIASEFPELTIHDINHLDALWETASEIAGEDYDLNPAEAFVLGGAILLHDAGICSAAYTGGIGEIKSISAWKDCAVPFLRSVLEREPSAEEINNPAKEIENQILFAVLRDRHAVQAEQLATMAWPLEGQNSLYLIENIDLRSHYGEQIGQIAHSHHLDVANLPDHLQREIPVIALPEIPIPSAWAVDCLKIACLLRTADAAHIDARRAPRQYRIYTQPTGISAQHWRFQERLGKARLDLRRSALLYGSGKKFDLADADAWWLCFDTIRMIDKELREADQLLKSFDIKEFSAKAVLGAETPKLLSEYIKTAGWQPVDARVQISDVTSVVKKLGGKELYGENPSIAVRELIQNAADSIRARRKLERNESLGRICVSIRMEGDDYWLDVEDDGIGMAEHILTGALLDFGKSFWGSPDLRSEWPGLAGSGFAPTGKFGIGFFSVFMLGDVVRVTSRRFDQGVNRAHTLEFRYGLNLRPILKSADAASCVLHGGTRVSVKLGVNAHREGEIFREIYEGSSYRAVCPVSKLVPWLVPMLDVDVFVIERCSPEIKVISAEDWKTIDPLQLLRRVFLFEEEAHFLESVASRVEPIVDAGGQMYGRGAVAPELWRYSRDVSSICVGGIRAKSHDGFAGVLRGLTKVLSRKKAVPDIPLLALSSWATEQEAAVLGLDPPLFAQGEAAESLWELGYAPESLKWCKYGTQAGSTKDLMQVLGGIDELRVCRPVVGARFGNDAEIGDGVSARCLNRRFVPLDCVLQVFGDRSGFTFFGSEFVLANEEEIKEVGRGLMRLVLVLLVQAWGLPIKLDESERSVVGTVGKHDIMRWVTTCKRTVQEAI